MNFHEYIHPELLILIPVIYFIGIAIKKSSIKNEYIPLVLGIISTILCSIWVFSTCEIFSIRELLSALFTSITQGILVAASSVYVNQLYKQSKNKSEND